MFNFILFKIGKEKGKYQVNIYICKYVYPEKIQSKSFSFQHLKINLVILSIKISN